MAETTTLANMENRTIRTPGGCWRWMGSIDRHGYGRLGYQGKTHTAHRVALLLRGIEIPTGMEVDHLCRNRRCVNPLHLDIVTGRVNTLRGMSFSAINARKTHCKRGHEFTPKNTLIVTGPGRRSRFCRACSVLRNAEYRARRKAS